MKYERITREKERQYVMTMWKGDPYFLKIYNRLAELEDKIESGEIDCVTDKDAEISRLKAEVAELRARLENHGLPVNVWDTIYCIRNWGKGRYEIEEHAVTEVVFEYNNQMRIKTSCGLFGCEKWTFGLDCFADKSEAEAHLKELQGGEQK